MQKDEDPKLETKAHSKHTCRIFSQALPPLSCNVNLLAFLPQQRYTVASCGKLRHKRFECTLKCIRSLALNKSIRSRRYYSMSSKKLPPLSAIVAFDAVVRLGTFTKAASELHLTQSAISKQIKRLELSLGAPLFERKGNEVILTNSGSILYRAVTQSLQCIKEAVLQIDGSLVPTLSISATSGIASYLVIPLISRFRKLHPKINVRVIGAEDRSSIDFADADFAILYGDGNWKDLRIHRIAEEEIFPICTSSYKKEHNIERLSDLANCDLIELESNDPATISTRQWMRQVGFQGQHSGSIIKVSSYDLAIKAALAGEGVALAWAEALPDEFRTNKLCRACDETYKTGHGQYIAYPMSRDLSPMAKTLWDWVLAISSGQPAQAHSS